MNIEIESKRTLERVWSGINLPENWKASEAKQFNQQLKRHFSDVFALLFELYGHRYDFYYHVQQLVQVLVNGSAQRSTTLKNKDRQRADSADWYLDESMIGLACYVDLFGGDLQGIKEKIPYLQDLGITYLHLMPLYLSPEGDSDGGYAVSDYRQTNPNLGTMDELKSLSDALAKADINLVLDFVFNHTSDEHPWAIAAQQGDTEYQDYYYMFSDRNIPDQYEGALREIFPQVRRGNFSWNEASQKWVWTTFNNFQWDLNYSNPAVFNAITEEMLFLANLGCSALRLDALAFIWKDMGTDCENRPKAHSLIKAFNACLKIVSPSVVFKSEAIVHPDEVVKYIDQDECQLSYNPLLMALLWNSLATRKTRLLTQSLRKSYTISPQCSWVNYIRCHDDIGWTFDDDLAGQLGINGGDHRYFLNQFYTGRFPGSFASGVAFGENPSTGDCRVCGSLASLCGLEQALKDNNQAQIDEAIKRILLVHSIIFSIGGVPLLYSGDELGLLNDYSYQQDPSKQHDDRWVQRIAVAEQDIIKAQTSGTPQSKIFAGLKNMIRLRKQHRIFGAAETHILDTDNQHVFAYARHNEAGHNMLAICNFSEHSQDIDSRLLDHAGQRLCEDILSGKSYAEHIGKITIAPYQAMWLIPT